MIVLKLAVAFSRPHLPTILVCPRVAQHRREVLLSPGNPATVSLIQRDVGQWLCVLPFRIVCLYQAPNEHVPFKKKVGFLLIKKPHTALFSNWRAMIEEREE